MPNENKTALYLANEVPDNLSLEELFELLTESEKQLVISFAEKLRGMRRTP